MSAASERDSERVDTPGLVRVLGVLRARWWVIALSAAVAVGAAVVYVERKPNQYTATSSLQFTANSLPSQVAGVGGGQALDPEGEKNTNVQLVTTTPVAQLVVDNLKLRETADELLGQVTASNPQNDYFVNIAATNSDPRLAAAIANAFAEQYVVYSLRNNEEQLIKGQQLIEQRASKLPATDTTDRANLAALSQKLLLLQAVASANARVANVAATPGAPSSPKRAATAVVALLFGLLAGVGLTFLLDALNSRVKLWEELSDLYGVAALAGVPQLSRRTPTARDREIELEPFRILHNSLALLAPGHDINTALVTSAVPGEGKTTIAIGLARAAALSGNDVVLVEADLRRPSFAERLSVDGRAPGLAAVLFDGEDPMELLQTPFPAVPRLRVLPAGEVPPDAADRLRPHDLTRAFEGLSASLDLVVIDSAPLLPVVDTRVLLDEVAVDATLIVARAGVTRREEIRGVRSLLDRRHLTSVGLVVNGLTRSAGSYYYGDYGADRASSMEEHPRLVGKPSRR